MAERGVVVGDKAKPHFEVPQLDCGGFDEIVDPDQLMVMGALVPPSAVP